MAALNYPIVLSFSGHDPCGGAGIQADIESANNLGVKICTVITALTVQDSIGVKRIESVDATLVSEQAKAILEDMPIAAFKLGMLGSIENIEAIHEILHAYRDIPVVVDPIIKAGDGTLLSDEQMTLAYSDLIFPLTTIATPNSHEALKLATESDSLFACAQELMDDGCEYVLITGTHETTPDIINSLYYQHKKLKDFHWPRLLHEYHGSGCTLAAAIAALLAKGEPVLDAVTQAQDFTWNSLDQGMQLGMGQFHPNRFYLHNH